MQRLFSLAVLAGLFVCSGALRAQEAVVIKLKERGEGEAIIIKKYDNVTTKLKIQDGKGKVLHEKNDVETEIAEFKETVIQRPAMRRPTKLQRDYVKLQTATGEKTEVSPLQGKTVVIEKAQGQYAFAFKDGGAVSGPGLAGLVKDFANKDDSTVDLKQLMLPKGAVKPGDSWKLDVDTVVREMFKGDGKAEIDAAKAVGAGRLLKSYKNGGRQYGEMQFQLQVPLKSMGKGAEQMKFAAGAKLAMDMVLHTCIDGSSEAGTYRITQSLNGTATLASLPGSVVTLSVASVAQGSQEEPAKKK